MAFGTLLIQITRRIEMKYSSRIYLQAGVVVCILAIVLSLGLGPVSKAQMSKKTGDDTPVADSKGFDELARKVPIETSMMGIEKLDVNVDGRERTSFAPSHPSIGNDNGDETEPNNTAGTANPLSGSEGRIGGLIYANGDIDFYSFTASAGDKVFAAAMTSWDASGSGNSTLDIIAPDGTTILETDLDDGTFGSTSSSIAGFNIPSAGTYYLRMRQNSATAQIRPYVLYFAIRSGAPTAETETNGSPGTANPLAASGHMSGSINPGADTDFYSVALNAGDTVFLSLNSDPERDNVQFNARLGFGLFGSGTPNQILLANDGSTGSATNPLSEAFFFTVKDAGTYYIYVDEAAVGGAATFTYTLSATVFPAENSPNCTTYTSTDAPKVINDVALTSSTLTIPPGSRRIDSIEVYLNMTHTFMQDLDVHLVSPNANDNGLFTDIGAATTGGPQTGMDWWVSDNAAIPPIFAVTEDFKTRPESSYRLEYLQGEDPTGTWRLDIRDDAAGDTGTLNGWALKVCQKDPDPPSQTLFSTDFEANDGGFTHNGTLDEWEYGTPATVATTTTNPVASFLNCFSGTKCWKTDLDNTYDSSSSMNLESPPIAIPSGSTGVRLSWAMRYQMESASFDHAWIEVFESGNPANIKRIGEWTGATMTNTVGSPAVNIGQSGGWGIYKSGDLSSFAGTSVIVRYHVDGDSTINFGGMAIDDVKVTRAVPGRAVRADYDGDGKTDLSIFRPGSGTFWVNRSTDGPGAIQWGASGDYAMGGDVNGDRETDLIINRPTAPTEPADFWVLQTPSLSFTGYAWGVPGDKPMIRDFNGDNLDDYAVWRETDTRFYILVPGDPNPVRIFQFGSAGDKPFVGDFMGDSNAEIAVFRPSTGTWYIAAASGNPATEFVSSPFGIAGDLPAPADFDGDGKDDVAVFRPSTGYWYIRRSSDQSLQIVQFGTVGDTPVPGDYDGDGKYDVAIFRNGQWWILQSSNSSVVVYQWGVAGDQPIPASYLPQ